jgi:hypothetical protein
MLKKTLVIATLAATAALATLSTVPMRRIPCWAPSSVAASARRSAIR